MAIRSAARASGGHARERGWPLTRDGLALVGIGLGCFFGVVVFLPAEGRIAGPLHEGIGLLLGRFSFLLPVGLAGLGVLVLLPAFVPVSRLAGVVVLTLTGFPTGHFVGLGTGLVGAGLAGLLLDWLGGPATAVVLTALLVVGFLLAFDLTLGQVAGGLAYVWRWFHPRAAMSFRVSPWLFAIRRPLVVRPAASFFELRSFKLRSFRLRSFKLRWGTLGTPGPPADQTDAAETLIRPEVADQPTEWHLPTIDVFRPHPSEEVTEADLAGRARVIEETLATFNIEAEVVEMNHGPAVTQFGVEPAPGVAVSRILSRQNDLALRLGISPIRLEAPVPGKTMVGVEVPNTAVATVTLRDVLASDAWATSTATLRLALGRDVSGKPIVSDLARMPHLLIAGATGSGKSVCVNTILGSLLFQLTPDQLQVLMIDPKRVELVGFGGLPHLRLPVITDMDRVVGALKWVVLEMDRRYKLFARDGVRNVEAYNRRQPGLPYLVVVIDELADMMMTAAEEVEQTLCRLAQLARATGIHLVVATQRPSVDVLTGLIKANFPTRVAFAVSSQTDSRVILDQVGAEKLLGRGDALFMPPDAMKPIRLQGAFVSDDEMHDLVGHWRAQGEPRYTPDELDQVAALGHGEDADDDVYDKACELAETLGRVSAPLLARRLAVSQARAQRVLSRLIEEGVAEE